MKIVSGRGSIGDSTSTCLADVKVLSLDGRLANANSTHLNPAGSSLLGEIVGFTGNNSRPVGIRLCFATFLGEISLHLMQAEHVEFVHFDEPTLGTLSNDTCESGVTLP